MFKSYLLISYRNLIRQKGYTAINIAGLAVGISSCLLILMLVGDELSYDRFDVNANRICRITLDARVQNREYRTAHSSGPVAASLRAEVPEVEAATHFRCRGGGTTGDCAVRAGDKAFNEYLFFYADSAFFKVFSCTVLEGDVRTFLTQPNTIVITDAMAHKYFGDAPALGKTLTVDGTSSFVVCGVVSQFPRQSHWRFGFLASLRSRAIPEDDWLNNTWYTYVLLKEGASRAEAESAFHAIIGAHVTPRLQQMFGGNWKGENESRAFRYRFQPVTDIHLHSSLDDEIFPQGNITTVSMLVVIAVFLLLIACINFMNLNTARSTHRAKEVGVRKVLGSQPRQLVVLFLCEALLLTAVASVISVGIMELALPALNAYTGKFLSLSWFATPGRISGLVIFALAVGMLAGSYPAFVLSRFQPAKVLKGEVRRGMHSGRLRSVLVISQFAISIGLIVGTIVVHRQLQFVRSRDLGFDRNQMLVIDNTWLLGEKAESFRTTLLGRPGILQAAFTNNLPGNDVSSGAYRREGSDKTDLIMMRQLWCGDDYLSFMNVKLKEGRYFTHGTTTAVSGAVVINARAATLLGYDHPVGRKLIGFFGDKELSLDIIGVTDDVHYEPLHQAILPMVTLIPSGPPTRIVLRVRGNIQEIISDAQEQWTKSSGGQPFTAFFLDERLERYYRSDHALGTLFGVFSLIGIFISCLGLLGLSTYATEQRRKEIGIRKILGASSPGLVTLLTREFVTLVLVANLIAVPVAYFAMQRWLEDFAYRIPLDADVFLLAGSTAFVIALLTVAYQTVRASVANPVESLRYE